MLPCISICYLLGVHIYAAAHHLRRLRFATTWPWYMNATDAGISQQSRKAEHI